MAGLFADPLEEGGEGGRAEQSPSHGAARLWQRARVPEDEQSEVPVAGQDDPVAVLVLGQGPAPEVVAVGVDVVADLGGVGRVGDVDDPEPARVPREVRQAVVVRCRGALVGVAPEPRPRAPSGRRSRRRTAAAAPTTSANPAITLNSALRMGPPDVAPGVPLSLISPIWHQSSATSLWTPSEACAGQTAHSSSTRGATGSRHLSLHDVVSRTHLVSDRGRTGRPAGGMTAQNGQRPSRSMRWWRVTAPHPNKPDNATAASPARGANIAARNRRLGWGAALRARRAAPAR